MTGVTPLMFRVYLAIWTLTIRFNERAYQPIISDQVHRAPSCVASSILSVHSCVSILKCLPLSDSFCSAFVARCSTQLSDGPDISINCTANRPVDSVRCFDSGVELPCKLV